jgi:hypothetical protein
VVDKQAEWLEPVLTELLGWVRAPEQLWYRVQTPQVSKPESSVRQLMLALAATLAVVTIVVGFRELRGNSMGNRGEIEFRSAKAGEVSAWVKANTGLDIPLPDQPAAVELVGARVMKGETTAVEVAYRVGGHDAKLVVSKVESGLAVHTGHRFLGNSGTRASSWIMRDQLYTLACAEPGDLRAACTLCHADGSTALN